eukprot:13656085-Alexandrium_andersonii.AAC.1
MHARLLQCCHAATCVSVAAATLPTGPPSCRHVDISLRSHLPCFVRSTRGRCALSGRYRMLHAGLAVISLVHTVGLHEGSQHFSMQGCRLLQFARHQHT